MLESQLYGPPKVGGDVLSYCTKCRMELAHIVVAMVDGVPVKVQCKTCKGTHRYKRETGASLKPRTARKSTPKTTIRVADLWEEKLKNRTADEAITYKPTVTFVAGNVVTHPKFGLGLVEQLRPPNKVVILFRDGERVLVHSMGAA